MSFNKTFNANNCAHPETIVCFKSFLDRVSGILYTVYCIDAALHRPVLKYIKYRVSNINTPLSLPSTVALTVVVMVCWVTTGSVGQERVVERCPDGVVLERARPQGESRGRRAHVGAVPYGCCCAGGLHRPPAGRPRRQVSGAWLLP